MSCGEIVFLTVVNRLEKEFRMKGRVGTLFSLHSMYVLRLQWQIGMSPRMTNYFLKRKRLSLFSSS